MASREELQTLLEDILQSEEVYYQPPESIRMSYPAIRYSLSTISNDYANNMPYAQFNSYALIVIDRDPDSDIVKAISKLPRCRLNNTYVADNLYHSAFTIQY